MSGGAYYEKSRDERPVDCWLSDLLDCDTHFHSSLELVYVLEGKVKVIIGGQTVTVTKGTAALTPSYSLHMYESEGKSKSYCLTLPPDIIPSYQSLVKNMRFKQLFYIDKNGELRQMLSKMKNICKSKADNKLMIKGLSYLIVGLLLEQLQTEPYPDKKSRNYSRDVLIYLQENFADSQTTLENTAKHFGYSKSRFAHVFTATFGYTFYDYLTLLRVRHAAGQLVNENKSLIDAAMSSGFENMRTFYRSFKKIFAKTPTQFIKDNSSFVVYR